MGAASQQVRLGRFSNTMCKNNVGLRRDESSPDPPRKRSRVSSGPENKSKQRLSRPHVDGMLHNPPPSPSPSLLPSFIPCPISAPCPSHPTTSISRQDTSVKRQKQTCSLHIRRSACTGMGPTVPARETRSRPEQDTAQAPRHGRRRSRPGAVLRQEQERHRR